MKEAQILEEAEVHRKVILLLQDQVVQVILHHPEAAVQIPEVLLQEDQAPEVIQAEALRAAVLPAVHQEAAEVLAAVAEEEDK